MIRINVVEGIKPPLPPATPKEIVEVCFAALLFSCVAGAIIFGAFGIISYLFR